MSETSSLSSKDSGSEFDGIDSEHDDVDFNLRDSNPQLLEDEGPGFSFPSWFATSISSNTPTPRPTHIPKSVLIETALVLLTTRHNMSTAVADLGTAAQKVDPIDRAAASLRAASMGGFATLVELLLKKHKQSFPAEFEDRILNGQDKDGAGPLFHAAFVGHADVIEVLLAQQGIKVNLKNAKDWTPLRAALGNDNADAAELLVEDANVIATKAFHVNWNPLCHASGAGYIHVVKLLLAKDGVKDEIDLQDGDGMTALYLASNNGHTRVVKSLLEAGAKLNQESKGYLMPLYGAASAGHARIVEILLGKGADASPRTHEGDSALDASVTGGHAAVAELLMDHLTKTD